MPWLLGLLLCLSLIPTDGAASGLLGDMFSKLLLGRLTGSGTDCSDATDTQGMVTNLMLQRTGNCKRGKAKRSANSPTTSPPTPQTDSNTKTYYVSQSIDARAATKSAVDWSQYYARNNGLTGPNIPSSSSPVSTTSGSGGAGGDAAALRMQTTRAVRPDIAGSQARMQAAAAADDDDADSDDSYSQSIYRARSPTSSTSSVTKSAVRGSFDPRVRQDDP